MTHFYFTSIQNDSNSCTAPIFFPLLVFRQYIAFGADLRGRLARMSQGERASCVSKVSYYLGTSPMEGWLE